MIHCLTRKKITRKKGTSGAKERKKIKILANLYGLIHGIKKVLEAVVCIK